MVGEAVFGAVAGLGKVASDIVGVVKGAKVQSKALGIQRDLANRQLALQESGLALAAAESDKERTDSTYKLNRLLQFYGSQADADRELAAATGSASSGSALSPGVLLLLAGAVGVFFILKK